MSRPVDAAPSGISAYQEQRLSTQMHRHRWDAEWIAGQRLTTDVVPSNARNAPGARETTATEFNPKEPVRFEQTESLARSTRARREIGPSPADNRSAMLPKAGPVQKARDLTAAVAATGPAEPGRDVLVETQTPRAPSPRAPLARSPIAFWRTDDGVRVAMRLRDPEAQAGGIITALRKWLRDAGLTLTQVLVNGRSHDGPAAPAGEPPRETHSMLNTRI